MVNGANSERMQTELREGELQRTFIMWDSVKVSLVQTAHWGVIYFGTFEHIFLSTHNIAINGETEVTFEAAVSLKYIFNSLYLFQE